MRSLLEPALGLALLTCLPACGEAHAAPDGTATRTTAQPPPGQREKMRMRAKAACKDKARKAECSLETPRGTLTGNCLDPRGDGLVCVPKRAQERMKRATAACEGKKAGEACEVQGRNGTRAGKCHKGPEALMCRVEGGRRR